jgi:hypothetical protein
MSERSEANPLYPPLPKGDVVGFGTHFHAPPCAKGDAGGFFGNGPPGAA